MFENLSSRERVLALLAASLVPITVVFALTFWINGKLSQKQSELTNLQSQVQEEQRKQLNALRASKRKAIYLSESLPSNVNDSKVQYWTWISNLAEEKIGVGSFSLGEISRETPKKYMQRDTVFTQITFSLNFHARIDQLTRFLYEFHNTKILHRITSLSITPDQQLAPGGSNAVVRLNTLDVRMTIEVAALADADSARDFEQESKDRYDLAMNEFEDSIAYRNIFGLPNNQPKFAAIGSKSADVGAADSFTIRATDDDEDDRLKFELVSTTVSGAKITQANDNDRFVKFEFPPLDEGSYKFALRVTDNGCPPKVADTEFTLRVNKPTPTVTNTKPEPKFKHAGQSYITSFASSRDGTPEVWINVRTTGDWHFLKVGDTFELDDRRMEDRQDCCASGRDSTWCGAIHL